jgi:hypothetical protein
VIDALAVYKDDAGDVEVMHLSNLSREEAIELGSVIGGLIGLGVDGPDGAVAGAAAGAEVAAENGVNVLGDVDGWDILDDIPNGSAGALILLEHQWVVPLRDAVVRAGGFGLGNGFISPLDLVEVGLFTAEEAARAACAGDSRGRRPSLTSTRTEMLMTRRERRCQHVSFPSSRSPYEPPGRPPPRLTPSPIAPDCPATRAVNMRTTDRAGAVLSRFQPSGAMAADHPGGRNRWNDCRARSGSQTSLGIPVNVGSVGQSISRGH